MPFDWNYFLVVCVNGVFTSFSEQVNSFFSKQRIKSRRLTDMFDLYGELFNKGVTQWHFFTKFFISK